MLGLGIFAQAEAEMNESEGEDEPKPSIKHFNGKKGDSDAFKLIAEHMQEIGRQRDDGQ